MAEYFWFLKKNSKFGISCEPYINGRSQSRPRIPVLATADNTTAPQHCLRVKHHIFVPHTKFIFAMQGPYCICISVMPIMSLITVGKSEKHVCHLKNDRRHEPLQAWIS